VSEIFCLRFKVYCEKVFRGVIGIKGIEISRNKFDIDLILMDMKMLQRNIDKVTEQIQ